jgi:hypothetical protein
MYYPFRGFVPILLGALLSLVTSFAIAQIANDNELYAAYCIGVLQQQYEEERKALLTEA